MKVVPEFTLCPALGAFTKVKAVAPPVPTCKSPGAIVAVAVTPRSLQGGGRAVWVALPKDTSVFEPVLTLIVWPQDAAATPVSAKADIERIPLFMLTIPSDFELPVRLPSRQRVTASKSTARGAQPLSRAGLGYLSEFSWRDQWPKTRALREV